MIGVKELLKLKNPNIIDIRSVENFNNNHIPSAKNIPYNKLIMETNKYLNYNQTYYIYCNRGNVSLKACNILRTKGYNVVNVIGGYEAWILSN